MSFMSWVKGFFTPRGKALALYRSGMAKAKRHDYDGAIADYSAAIAAPHIPDDVKAMVLYNRALAYSSIHEDEKSAADLTAVLEMPGLPRKVKAEAQERRERIRWREERETDRETRPEAE